MNLNEVEPKPLGSSSGNSTVYAAHTPPETVVDDLDDYSPSGGSQPISSSVPWPDSTFIIRSASSGQVITLLDGQIVLASPGSRGSIHWTCVEAKGWLGFRNVVSGGFLGHDKDGRLCCTAKRHQGWENFCVRMRPEGGFILLMTHFDQLRGVGIKVEKGVEKLAKVEKKGSNGVVWEFVMV